MARGKSWQRNSVKWRRNRSLEEKNLKRDYECQFITHATDPLWPLASAANMMESPSITLTHTHPNTGFEGRLHRSPT